MSNSKEEVLNLQEKDFCTSAKEAQYGGEDLRTSDGVVDELAHSKSRARNEL